jgi:hypothetical protein
MQDQIGSGVQITEITMPLCNSVQIGSSSESCGGEFGNLWSYKDSFLYPAPRREIKELLVLHSLEVAPLHRNDFPISLKGEQL